MIKSIQIRNLLSFGPETPPFEMRPLSVLIGPNGGGKTNVLDVLGLLRSLPQDLERQVRTLGGMTDLQHYSYQANPDAYPSIEIVVEGITQGKNSHLGARYGLSFGEVRNRFEIVDEYLENAEPFTGQPAPHFYYRFQAGKPVVNTQPEEPQNGKKRELQPSDLKLSQSVLAQMKDKVLYPELWRLSKFLQDIAVYREWGMGRFSNVRRAQDLSYQTEYLEEDFINLATLLQWFKESDNDLDRVVKERLADLFEGCEDYGISIRGSQAVVHIKDRALRRAVNAERLSDGTLRFLCLVAILCHPQPPSLICLDEPELGLHPDLLVTVGRMIKAASERTQVIVTTHSSMLVSLFSNQPEVIVTVERENGCTKLNRLDPERAKDWMENYNGDLGSVWSSGIMGGNRW